MTKKFAVAIMVLIVALFSDVAAAQSGFYVYGAVGNTDSEIATSAFGLLAMTGQLSDGAAKRPILPPLPILTYLCAAEPNSPFVIMGRN